MSDNIKEKIKRYMNLPYEKRIIPAPQNKGGGYYVEVPLLGSSSTYAWGETETEALETLKEIMESNFETWISEGIPIPEPEEKTYSGRIALRISPSIHKKLAEIADSEEISTNQLINNYICEMLGTRRSKEHIHYYAMGFLDIDQQEIFKEYRQKGYDETHAYQEAG